MRQSSKSLKKKLNFELKDNDTNDARSSSEDSADVDMLRGLDEKVEHVDVFEKDLLTGIDVK